MPRNGSGTYAAPANSFNPAVTGNTASPTDWNSTLADISSALTSSIAKDGQTVITANLPMAGYKHTNVGAAVNRTDYARYDQLQDASVNWVDGGGTADAITATYNPAIATLIDGQLFFVRATAANATTTPTFSPNGLPPRTIVKNGGAALIAGDIAGDGHELILRYDLTNTRYELLNPSDADAARKSVNNTFTGTNTFNGTTNIPDGTVSTYAKIASSVFASVAEIIAGTASKIVNAANFKLGLRGLESYTLLSSQTASNSTSLNFTSLITSEFDEYVFEFLNIVPSVSGAIFNAQLSSDNGSSWLSTANYSRCGVVGSSGSSSIFGINQAGVSSMDISGSLSSAARYSLSGQARLLNPLNTTNCQQLSFHLVYTTTAPAFESLNGHCQYNPTTLVACNAIKFAMSSGNISSGTIRVYGIRKT